MGTLAVDNIQHTDGSSAVTLNNAGITGGTIGSAVTGTLGSGVTVEGTLNSNTTFSGDAGQRTAKAWVNFDGTDTATPSDMYDSFNVSSVTYSSTGQYIVNFITDFSATDYCCIATAAAGSVANTDRLAASYPSAVDSARVSTSVASNAANIDVLHFIWEEVFIINCIAPV